MSGRVYRIATYEELAELKICDEYEALVGPDDFRCVLTEPEDRYWFRDGYAAVVRLNEQHDEIERLRATDPRTVACSVCGSYISEDCQGSLPYFHTKRWQDALGRIPSGSDD
jgi:hypothetical protein